MRTEYKAPLTGSPPSSREGPKAPVANTPDLRLALSATLLALIVFAVLQAFLAAYNIDAIRDAAERGMYEISTWDRMTILSRLFPRAIVGIIDFVALAIAGSVIASHGHRVLFALPAVAYVFAGVFVSPHHPEPLGIQWSIECFSNGFTCTGPWFGHPWFGPTVDLCLLLVPGCVVAVQVRSHRPRGPKDSADVAALLTCFAAVATAAWAMVVVQNWIDLRAVAAVAAFGLVTGIPRPRWLWYHMIFALALAQSVGSLLEFVFWPEPSYPLSSALPSLLAEIWPIVVVGLLAAAWHPLAWLIRSLREQPLRLLIAVNVLNVVDAVLTLLAVHSGSAFESNPFVRVAGLPMKVLFVGAMTILLYRRKPSALVWPFAALLWVAAYHVAGIFVNGWR
jgi:hypothetical protein